MIYKIEINRLIPHNKSREIHNEWVILLHSEIDLLAKKQAIRMFGKAFVGILLSVPPDYAKRKLWDTDNRALHLIFNNLKGIFFLDDDYLHMCFGVFGKESSNESTVIFIGDVKDAAQICSLMAGE